MIQFQLFWYERLSNIGLHARLDPVFTIVVCTVGVH